MEEEEGAGRGVLWPTGRGEGEVALRGIVKNKEPRKMHQERKWSKP